MYNISRDKRYCITEKQHETTQSNVEKAKIPLLYYIGANKYKNKIIEIFRGKFEDTSQDTT